MLVEERHATGFKAGHVDCLWRMIQNFPPKGTLYFVGRRKAKMDLPSFFIYAVQFCRARLHRHLHYVAGAGHGKKDNGTFADHSADERPMMSENDAHAHKVQVRCARGIGRN
jgi:hypothetical protein